jgi:hypothetical protein
MWEQLDVPAEEVTAFLSECDLLAPFSPRVLEMYQDMYRRLTNAGAAAAVAAAAPTLAPIAASRVSAGFGGASPTAAAMQARAEAVAEQFAEASAAAAARAQAAVASLASGVTPRITNTSSRRNPGHAAATGFRSTTLGTPHKSDDSDDVQYLRSLTQGQVLPPSLGGPGARTQSTR